MEMGTCSVGKGDEGGREAEGREAREVRADGEWRTVDKVGSGCEQAWGLPLPLPLPHCHCQSKIREASPHRARRSRAAASEERRGR